MRYSIALFGLALALPHAAAAQAYDWRPVNRETATMLRAGQYDAALPLIEAALAGCPNAATSLEAALCTAIFDENLSNVREHQGNLAEAEADLRKTLELRASVLPPDDPLIDQAHFFLAQFFQRQGRWADEVASLQAAETIARAGGTSHRSELAGLMSRHAMALAALGRPAEALPLYQEAYDISRAVGGPASRDALITLGNLFTGQIAAGFPDAAIDAVSAVLASPDVTSFDPTQRALLAGKLALETATAPRSKAALSFAEAALPDLDNGLVTDPDASFTLLRGAARLNAGVGDANRAVQLARRARAVAAGKWGPASYAVTSALRTEAEADEARHEFPEAIARLQDAAAMLDGPQSGFTRVQIEIELGKLQSRAGRDRDAIASHLAMLDSPVLADAVPTIKAAMLALLGEDLVRLEAFEPGAKACGQAIELAAHQSGLAKDYTVRALLCSGNAALALGRSDQALDAANRAQATLWANVSPPAEPNRISQILVADLRARAFRDSGRNSEALPAYRDELALAHKAGDVVSEGAVWAQIATVQRLMGQVQGLGPEQRHRSGPAGFRRRPTVPRQPAQQPSPGGRGAWSPGRRRAVLRGLADASTNGRNHRTAGHRVRRTGPRRHAFRTRAQCRGRAAYGRGDRRLSRPGRAAASLSGRRAEPPRIDRHRRRRPEPCRERLARTAAVAGPG